MIVQILTYGLFGLLTGLGAQALMQEERLGSAWIAALLGVDAALTGQYLSRSLLYNPGEGTTLFVVVLVTFIIVSAYRTVFHRLIDGPDRRQTRLSWARLTGISDLKGTN